MDHVLKNNFEKAPVETKTFTPKELRELIVGKEHEIKDARFLPKEEGGVFHYFRPEDLRTEDYFPIVREGDVITGIASLEKSPFEEKVFWMKSISVDPKYQGKHYATKLVEEICKFTKEQGYQLEISGYSNKDAKDKLERLFAEYAEKYGVVLVPNR